MTDVRLVQRGSAYEAVTLDLLLTPAHDLDTEQELVTAVTVALFTDALLDPDELASTGGTDRRGWWGDLDAEEIWDGWPIGSKLSLLRRKKITGAGARQGPTTAIIKAYINEAIQPMIDHKIASDLKTSISRVGNEQINGSMTLYRGPATAIDLRYDDLWAGIIASAPTV